MECVRWRARIPSPGCDRAARGLPHGVLYGATLLHDVPRRVPRRRGRAAPHPRVAGRDDAAARGARRPRLRGRLPRRPRPARRRGAPGARTAHLHAARDGARRGRPRAGLGALRQVAGAPVAGRMAPGRVLPAGARQVPRRRAVRRDRGAAGVRARRRERHAHRSTAHRRRGQRRCPRRLGDQRSLAALPDRQRAALRALLPRRRAGTPRLLGNALMLLTLVVFSPLAGAALVALLPREEGRGIRRAALAFALVTLALSLVMLGRFRVGVAEFQMVERAAWIPQWGIEYRLGVDGVSLFLVLLTTVLTPIVVLASWGDIHRRVKEFFAFLLVLETGMLGTFVALDMFLFYVFWEVMLVPMYFLIGVWGGPRRIYAALKFVLFTMVGSLLMLVAILYCAWRVRTGSGMWSFAYETWLARLALSPREQLWLFAAFALAFPIKVPLFPLPTSLPHAHVRPPTGG